MDNDNSFISHINNSFNDSGGKKGASSITRSGSSSKRVTGIGRIIKKEMLPFTQKLAALSDAGVPLLQALDSLTEQTDHAGMKAVCVDLYNQIEAGGTFSDALKKYPMIFDQLFVSSIEAGEAGGNLPAVLERLALYMEESAELRRKVKGAMMYPTIVIIAACIITALLVIFVVPTFVSMFADFGAELPAPTQILMDISDFCTEQWYFVIAIVVGTVVSWKFANKNESFSLAVSKSALNSPPFGKIVTMVVMARFSRTFASLTASGLPMLKALDIVGRSTGNKFMGTKMVKIKEDVEHGNPLADSMVKSGLFPKMMLQMVQTGEQTGQVDKMLGKMADYYEKEVKATLDGLSTVIEPVLMLIVGTIIGGIAFAMFMPIFSMGEAVGM